MNIPWPRAMLPDDEFDVRYLYKLCYPALAEPLPFWYFVNPTLVVHMDGQVVGSTSFTVVIAPGFGSTMYGKDLCVHPEYRGRGMAWLLHVARLSIARAAGVQTFMGITSKHNEKMWAILEKSGMHRCVPVNDDIMFVGPIPEV